MVVNIDTGVTEDWLRFVHTLDALYDIAILPGVTQPGMIGFQGDAMTLISSRSGQRPGVVSQVQISGHVTSRETHTG